MVTLQRFVVQLDATLKQFRHNMGWCYVAGVWDGECNLCGGEVRVQAPGGDPVTTWTVPGLAGGDGQAGPCAGPPACRGCGEPLTRRGSRWAGPAGVEVCVKARLEDIGGGRRPDYVFHEPMPAGLRGGAR